MRHAFLVALLCFIAAPIARAQDAAPKPAANSVADRVQLVEDDENGALRIVIDGREVGRFDTKGLHIENLIAPTGALVLPREAIPDWDRRESGSAP